MVTPYEKHGIRDKKAQRSAKMAMGMSEILAGGFMKKKINWSGPPS
jgi:hypothetical protein